MKTRNLLTHLGALLFFSSLVSPVTAEEFNPATAEIVKQLDWLPNTKLVCNGYYRDPLAIFNQTTLPNLSNQPIKINADQVTLYQTQASVLQGNVIITQPGRFIHADHVTLKRDTQTAEISTTDLQGHVVFREPNKIVVGNKAHIELKTRAGNFWNVLYRLLISNADPASNTNTPIVLNAWGKAEEVQQDKAGKLQLDTTTYTTCAPGANAWHVASEQINLNPDSGVGSSYNTRLYVGNVPIFYWPYLTFPIDSRRKSGFLFPNLSHSTWSGYGFGVPYYWNIATNYDALITPQLLTDRGLQINGLFRYLTTAGAGFVNAGFIPDDRKFAKFKDESEAEYTPTTPGLNHLLDHSNNRGFFSWKDQHTFAPRWTSTIDYNYVSDDYYLQDFGGIDVVAQNQLLKQAKINYAGNIWNFSANIQAYQTLHLINQSVITNAYQKLPEISLNGSLSEQKFGLNYQFINQLVYFQRNTNPGELIKPPNAIRLNVEPSVNLPLVWSGAFIKPNLQISARSYQIGNQAMGYASSIQQVIPLLSIDSGLYFDRYTQLRNTYYQQTLEPRLFYLYVPYRNQNSIPIFDSALTPFNYDSLFLTNRFSGYDRIGDANQIALALTTRLLDADSGLEKFRASIGELYYFRDRQIQLCSGVDAIVNASMGATCFNPNALAGITSPTETTSPIAAQMRYAFNKDWNTTANIAWDPNTRQTVSGNLNLQYQPTLHRVFNVNYNYLRFGDIITSTTSPLTSNGHFNDLNQGGFSFGWPVADHWAAVGGWNYNFGRHYFQTYFYGVEYDSCCWSTRVIAGKTFNSLNENGNPVFNNAIYLQWQLKGLGTISNGNPNNLLLNNLPGYQDNFKAITQM